MSYLSNFSVSLCKSLSFNILIIFLGDTGITGKTVKALANAIKQNPNQRPLKYFYMDCPGKAGSNETVQPLTQYLVNLKMVKVKNEIDEYGDRVIEYGSKVEPEELGKPHKQNPSLENQ